MSEGKDYYRRHHPPDAPLFHLSWWMDAVCGDRWQAAILKSGNELSAYYLYAMKKDAFGQHIFMPHLTQFLGPYYRLQGSTVRERNNEETEILEQLIAQLPAFGSFESRWQSQFQNWLPFHWKKFQQRTRYTYVLADILDPERLRSQFSEKIQREIAKAEKLYRCEETAAGEELFTLIGKNFSSKKMKVPFEESVLKSAFEAAIKQQSGKILLAKDPEGMCAAGIFIAWDANTAYYIIGAKETASGNSGAMSFLFWNAFNLLKGKVKSFDFEGSMIKGVENYFRSFGAEQKGFFEITRINSPLLKMKSAAKSFLGK